MYVVGMCMHGQRQTGKMQGNARQSGECRVSGARLGWEAYILQNTRVSLGAGVRVYILDDVVASCK